MDGVIEIKSKSLRDDGRVCLDIEVSNGRQSERVRLCIIYELLEDVELSLGEISGEQMSCLELLSEVSAAYGSACASFAYTPSSLRALWLKLVQKKGFAREVADRAIELVRKRGFVDEVQIALRRAELCVGKKWGRTRIMMQLRRDGFEDEALDAVREYLDCEVDFVENCAALIVKKYGEVPTDRREREKIFASMSAMGYTGGQIKQALEYVEENL
jgi:SOS response regulatory protein OraA/RecX